MIMKEFLNNYLSERLKKPGTKTAKNGVSPTSFAAFLREALPYIEKFRDDVFGRRVYSAYINHETGAHWTLEEMEDDLDKGFELIRIDNQTDQEAGAELVMSVARKGRVAALLLYATHMLADSGKRAEIEQAKVWIHAVLYEKESKAKFVAEEAIQIAEDLLEDYYEAFPEEGKMRMDLDEDEQARYATFVALSDNQYYSFEALGDIVHGIAMIGSIKIVCGWFKKLEEYVVKEDSVVAYVAPCLPTWYFLESLKNLIGIEKLNELAGVFLFSDNEDSLSPAYLQYSLDEENLGLTHFLWPGSCLKLAHAWLLIKETDDERCSLNYNEEEGIWVYSIPDSWDCTESATQRRLAQQVNAQLFKIASQVLPEVYSRLTNAYNLPSGECHVIVEDSVRHMRNSNDGFDVFATYHLIKYPEEIVDILLLSCFVPSAGEEKMKKAVDFYKSSGVDGLSTTVWNEKLCNKKPKYYPEDFNVV